MRTQTLNHEFALIDLSNSSRGLWVRVIARCGYAARGIVYLLVGGLALLSAVGQGGKTGDQKDALETLLSAPAGAILLGILSFGLLCFAAWRMIQATFDTDHHGHDAKGWVVRIALLVSAVTQIALAIAAAKMAWGAGQSGGDETRSWSAWILQHTFGRWMLGACGVAFIATGVAVAVKGLLRKYEKWFDLEPATLKRLAPLFQLGLAARGFVFGTIGAFILYAAWQYDSNQAGGLSDVFDKVRTQPFGAVMIALLAGGLFGFGVYGVVQARYRRVNGDGSYR